MNEKHKAGVSDPDLDSSKILRLRGQNAAKFSGRQSAVARL